MRRSIFRIFFPLSPLFTLFLYQTIALAGESGAPDLAAVRRVWVVLSWEVGVADSAGKFEIESLLPRTVPGHQVVHGMYSSVSDLITVENEGNLYASWNCRTTDNPQKQMAATGDGAVQNKAQKVLLLKIAVDVSLFTYSLEEARQAERAGIKPEELTPFMRRRYLSAETKVETGAYIIKQASDDIPDGADEVETAENIMRYITGHMSYGGFSVKDVGALAALRNGAGDCTDFVDLFVTLCRIKRIPARHVSGVLTRWISVPGHSWAEFYSRKLGWVGVDPLHIEQQSAKFGLLPAKYLRLSDVRNDERLGGGMLYRWRTEGPGGALVNFTVTEYAKNPLQLFKDIRWSRIQ